MGADTAGSDDPWDDDHDADEFPENSVLDALFETAPATEFADSWETPDPASNGQGDSIETLLVTATNPAGTVTTTVLLNGQVVMVELSPQVTAMTESELAEEITIISTLARKQAQAAQHAVAAAHLRQLGNDSTSTRAFLEHDLGLPSPATVLQEKSELFTARYAAHD
jgi:hypothetical protein